MVDGGNFATAFPVVRVHDLHGSSHEDRTIFQGDTRDGGDLQSGRSCIPSEILIDIFLHHPFSVNCGSSNESRRRETGPTKLASVLEFRRGLGIHSGLFGVCEASPVSHRRRKGRLGEVRPGESKEGRV